MAAHHQAREIQEVAQYADYEAREDHRDSEQTFEGSFSTTKLKEVLHMLCLVSADELPEVMRDLEKSKKKSNDTWIL